MRRSISLALAPYALLSIALVSSVVACGGTTGGTPGRISVVTSFYPLEYFTVRVAGNRAVVIDLVKPGVAPHDFEPTSDDIKSVASAHVVVHNGLGLEPWLDRALASVSRKDQIVVAAGEAVGTDAIRTGTNEEGSAGPDPHVWLDPRLAAREVEAIRDALTKADPEGAGEYQSNADSLIADLNALDLRFTASFASCRLDHFVTAHEAFGYLAARYGLEQIGITGVEQEEPDPAQLARIVDAIRANDVKFVLTEPGPSPKIAETVAREVGAQVRELDPIEFQAEGEDYLTAMERNRNVLREALECSG